ncbi:MAG: hypothetical protein RLZZ37_91, partial [Actinomycetota bacterium]
MIKYHIFKRLIGISLAILYLSYRVSNVFLVIPFFDEYDSPAYFEWNIYPSF